MEKIAQGLGHESKRTFRSQIFSPAVMQDKDWDFFARVIGPAKCRIIAVIRRDDDEIVGFHFAEKSIEPRVEFFERFRIANYVTPVPEEHVEIDQIREDEAVLKSRPQLRDSLHPFRI